MSLSIAGISDAHLKRQKAHTSKMLASYLAMTSTQYVVNNDSLGINVLLNKMLKDQVLDFASVYDANNQLIAQVGVRDSKVMVFSEQITFQDTAAGYVQVGFNSKDSKGLATQLLSSILIFHATLGLIILMLIWLSADFFSMWVRPQPLGPASEPRIDDPADSMDDSIEPLPDNPDTALLVLKLTPARLAATHKPVLTSAAALYGGKLVDTHSDDLVFQFRSGDIVFAAACSGLLALTLVRTIGPPLNLKAGIHWLDETTDDEEKASKHASYLASIGEQVVLTSRSFEAQLEKTADVTSQAFHSSLAPDGEVFEVISVKNQALIESQAAQLLNQR